ncbi:MAG TPA: ABC transporter permease [Vicinamibacterales bacterium]|jgi:predicted permease|nr:ABC transporter permease [Vicinamibacterales bacterium]
MQNLVGAIRYALRQFHLSPVFTASAVLTLALGIGGTTAIFTLIHAVMLRSLPVTDPESLYRIGDGDNCCVQGGPQDRWGMFSFPLFERLKAETPEFDQLTAFQAGGFRVGVRRPGVDVAARSLRSEYVTGNYFTTFGIGAFGGRVFSVDDDTPASPPVVVLSHHTWQATYGGDQSLVGATLVIEGRPFTVAGVAPPGFFGDTLRNNPPDLWIPIQHEPMITGGNSLLRQPVSAWLRVIGRLKPGATTDGIAPRLTNVLRQWIPRDSGWPANWLSDVDQLLPKQTIAIVPAGAGVGVMKEQYASSLRLLMAVCGLVLLIACANVANLLLARAVVRRTQTAIRLAIGASRAQIVTQALIESILLSIGGGIAGLLVATGAARLLLSLAFSVSTFLPISTWPSPLVLAFAFGVSVITGIIFGAVPAWLATRTDPIGALRGSGRSTGDHSSFTRTALLVLQATLSIVLVAGATMLGRSLSNVEHQNFGYDVRDRVLVAINRPAADYTVPQLTAMYRTLEERLTHVPGIQGVGLALYNPLTDNWGELVLVAGHAPPKLGDNAGASWDRVSAHYLQNLGMTMKRGRAFTEADNETTAPAAIVNEAFVARFFKSDEDPIGQHFGLDEPENVGTYTIVGVVRDAKWASFQLQRPARPMFYVPLAQNVNYVKSVMTRVEYQSHFISGLMLVTKMQPGAIEPLVTKAMSEVDPNLTFMSARTLEQQVALSFDQERAVASLAGLFGAVSLVLAAIGLYGVTAYAVAQRTNEIGIRMALGAAPGAVLNLVLRSAFTRVAIGLGLGVPLAIGAGKLLAAQLYGVTFWDPVALAVAAGSLSLCALIAALIPAARAASIPPMRALRSE